MIIIQLKGGLGNQMFQYALYRQLKSMGKEVKIDDESGFVGDQLRIPVISRFGVEYDKATKEEITLLTDAKLDIFSRIRRKLFGRKSHRVDENSGIFDPKILEMDEAYLVGYWQSDKYFPDESVIESLRNDFQKRPQEVMNDSISWSTLQQIECCESVSLHVRRTDYVDEEHIKIHYICTEKYYKGSIDYVRKQVPGAVFFIFTDDKEWCRKHFSGPKFIVVDLNEEDNTDMAEMLLMSKCKHHILANSSFSWWSAWLNDSPEKLVVVPDKWINNRDMDDIYTKRMTRVAI